MYNPYTAELSDMSHDMYRYQEQQARLSQIDSQLKQKKKLFIQQN